MIRFRKKPVIVDAYPDLAWWRRLLLRLARFEPAAVWDTPDQPQVFYEDEEIPPGSNELWGPRLSRAEREW